MTHTTQIRLYILLVLPFGNQHLLFANGGQIILMILQLNRNQFVDDFQPHLCNLHMLTRY